MWKHQEEAVKNGLAHQDWALFMDMGTGKTRTIVEILRRRYAVEGRIKKTLIFAPPVVCENWKHEFGMFSKINPREIVVLSGSQHRRVSRLIEELGEVPTRNKIVVTNYEATQMKDLYALFTAWRPEILVCDEAQRLKNPESRRAKAVARLADAALNNYILTGTPILNSPMDLFMQFRVLDRGDTFGKNFFGFRHQYFHDENAKWKGKQNYFPKWGISPTGYEELQQKVSAKATRVRKSDCLDLPPFIRMPAIAVSLSAEQHRLYKDMRDDYIAFIEAKSGDPRAVVAQLAVTKALRLQQIVSGFAKDETGAVHRLACPRLDALSDLLVDLTPQHKVIVWCVFRENYAMIGELCDKLGIGYKLLTGDQSAKEKNENMDDFRQDNAIRVLVANQSAGGVGVNLVEASYSIYYSKGFKLEDDLQSEARNYRGGSEIHEKVTRIDLCANGTIDELVNKALEDKQQISDRILNWTEKL